MLSCPSFQRIRTSFSDGCVISAISGRSVETPPMLRVLTCAARFSATRRKARALSDSGMDWTMGFPSSEVVRMSVERGISPKKGTSLAAANRRAPPLPKISSRWPQCRHSKPLMFSTNPKTGDEGPRPGVDEDRPDAVAQEQGVDRRPDRTRQHALRSQVRGLHRQDANLEQRDTPAVRLQDERL